MSNFCNMAPELREAASGAKPAMRGARRFLQNAENPRLRVGWSIARLDGEAGVSRESALNIEATKAVYKVVVDKVFKTPSRQLLNTLCNDDDISGR
jgi:hypothetical protein